MSWRFEACLLGCLGGREQFKQLLGMPDEDAARVIEVEGGHGRPADRRQADNMIVVPSEMFLPTGRARVE